MKYALNHFDSVVSFTEEQLKPAHPNNHSVLETPGGDRYHTDFLYDTPEKAEEVAQQAHRAISDALSDGELLKALSLSKERDRRCKGMSKAEIEQAAEHDVESYNKWEQALAEQAKRALGKDVPLLELTTALKLQPVLDCALRHPLAVDFVEISYRRATREDLSIKLPSRKPEEPTKAGPSEIS